VVVPISEWQREIDRAWHDDVALEMWVDVTKLPVVVRLAGVLDASTGANLLDVVGDCMAQGQLDFVFDMSALCVDGSGWPLVDRIRVTVEGAGGRLTLTQALQVRETPRTVSLHQSTAVRA
jgi:hypothetical protein